MRDAVRYKESWKRRRAPTQDPSTDLHDVGVAQATTLERVLPIISNTELLDANQRWSGEAGRLIRTIPAVGSGSFNNTAENGSCKSTSDR